MKPFLFPPYPLVWFDLTSLKESAFFEGSRYWGVLWWDFTSFEVYLYSIILPKKNIYSRTKVLENAFFCCFFVCYLDFRSQKMKPWFYAWNNLTLFESPNGCRCRWQNEYLKHEVIFFISHGIQRKSPKSWSTVKPTALVWHLIYTVNKWYI